jgi:hypothetical protein
MVDGGRSLVCRGTVASENYGAVWMGKGVLMKILRCHYSTKRLPCHATLRQMGRITVLHKLEKDNFSQRDVGRMR